MAWGYTARLIAFVPLLLQAVTSQSTFIDHCEALIEVISIREAETAIFTILPYTVQASC